MDSPIAALAQFGANSKQLFRRVLAIGENRLDLLLVELEEERNQLLRALGLLIGVAVLSFLAGVALTLMIVVSLWNVSPIGALTGLACLYAGAAFFLYRRLLLLQRAWKILPATFDQLRKDRECLEKNLS
jgi:uncharacterized membrane protein YqjE